MTQGVPAEVAKVRELLVRVVDTLYERVLVCWTASRTVGVPSHGIIEAQQRVAPHPGHEGVSRALYGRMKRDGQRKLLWFAREARDHGDDAACRDRKVPCSDSKSVGGIEPAQRTKRRIVVCKRLALSHHYHARHALVKVVAYVHYLIVYLVGCERACETCGTGCAKRASHATACLRGCAYGKALVAGHANALDHYAVFKAK